MKFCPHCGASLADVAASFCPECGKQLRTNTEAAPPLPAQRQDTQEFPAIAPQGEKVVHKAGTEPPVPETLNRHKKRWRDRPPRNKRKSSAPEALEDDDAGGGQGNTACAPLEDGYDGYYEDILPVDEGNRKTERLDPDMMKKVALIAGGTLLFVVAAIVVLLLM